MNDNEAVDKLIKETDIDPDSLAIERCTKEIHEICARRGWPAGGIILVNRSADLAGSLGFSEFVKTNETMRLMVAAGREGVLLANIIHILQDR